jgi:hypothetical protein
LSLPLHVLSYQPSVEGPSYLLFCHSSFEEHQSTYWFLCPQQQASRSFVF